MGKFLIYQFPTIEDRLSAETALKTFLQVQNGISRTIMLMTLKSILERYRLSKLRLENCVLELKDENGWVVIKPKSFITGRNCPGCGEELYSVSSKVRILSICEGNNSDFVSYGCSCGEVFGKVESTHLVN